MKIYALSIILFMLLASGCSAIPGYTASNNQTLDDTDYRSTQHIETETANYVQIIDELISNGCDIQKFELVERNKVLDMKIACK